MFALPKVVVIVVVVFAVWYAMRWWNRAITRLDRRRQAPSSPRAIQDLVACRICGAYAAADAGGCGRPDCPHPR
ncbi:MAG: hypothetical protein ACHQC9_01640 [Alphaproteobacteria bacterium]